MFNGYPYTDFHELNLDWIVKHFKEFVDELASLDSWRSQHEQEYQELKSFMDWIMDGHLPDATIAQIRAWLERNAFDIIGEMIKHVYFGLNDAGYFVVTIPRQWRELVFHTTGYDIELALQPEFGHLVLSY